MPTVYKASRSSDDPSRWMLTDIQATPVVVLSDKGAICVQCQKPVKLSPDLNLYLREEDVCHQACLPADVTSQPNFPGQGA